ncbi:hypothetical protein [Gilvimarinus sp. DA14]|uniref:hypothetical protein n=1 Tax=Gilvimarinus sp. DA14 TaxID=2956798 RepID=UPI0020B681AF|nr:hypothetical protein [Gilvimarinus sp. DA14]UTF61280.1 hypothetical protein NHM04_05630 [Gilvimarinus sp. DA14]
MRKILLLITVLFAAVFTMPAWSESLSEGALIEWTAWRETAGWRAKGDEGSRYNDLKAKCGSEHLGVIYQCQFTEHQSNPDYYAPFITALKCDLSILENYETDPFTYIKFLGADWESQVCRASVVNICSDSQGQSVDNVHDVNGSMCSGACEATETEIPGLYELTGAGGACQNQDQGSSSSSGQSSSDSGSNSSDGGDGGGGGNSSDGGETGGSSSSSGQNSSSSSSDCGFDTNCDGTIDGDDYDYIDEDGCYVGHDTTRYCQDQGTSGPDDIPNNCFAANGQVFCPDIDGDGEGDGGEGEGDGSTSSAGSSSSSDSNSSDSSSSDPTANGGDSCGSPPTCEGDDVGCANLFQLYYQRCPDVPETDVTVGEYDGEADHTLDIGERLQQAKDEFQSTFDTVAADLKSHLSLSVSGSGGDLPCESIEIKGKTLETGVCVQEEFWSMIRGLLVAAASLIAAYIILVPKG